MPERLELPEPPEPTRGALSPSPDQIKAYGLDCYMLALGKETLKMEIVQNEVERLLAANIKLVGALDMVRETLSGATVDDVLYIINTALAEAAAAAKMSEPS